MSLESKVRTVARRLDSKSISPEEVLAEVEALFDMAPAEDADLILDFLPRFSKFLDPVIGNANVAIELARDWFQEWVWEFDMAR